jgi:hypothetical protein
LGPETSLSVIDHLAAQSTEHRRTAVTLRFVALRFVDHVVACISLAGRHIQVAVCRW